MRDMLLRQTILAIHGSASSGKQWQSLRNMAQPPYDFLAPTIPETDAKSRFNFFADTISQCSGPVHVVAHSFGAAIALKLINHMSGQIASVSLYDPVVPIERKKDLHLPTALLSLSTKMRLLGPEEGSECFIDFWAVPGSWSSGSAEWRAAVIKKHGSVLRDFDQVCRGQWTPAKIAYDGPLTLLQGGNSPAVIDEIVRYLVQSYPNVRTQLLPGADHLTPLTRPDLTDDILMNSLYGHAQANVMHHAC